jgi:hypothetical protein
MVKNKRIRSAKAAAAVALMATALVSVLPASAVAESGPASVGRAKTPGYVCDRVEKDERAGIGSGRCLAVNGAHRRGDLHGAFTIKSRHRVHTLHCASRGKRPSGHANLPKWVRGEHCT